MKVLDEVVEDVGWMRDAAARTVVFIFSSEGSSTLVVLEQSE